MEKNELNDTQIYLSDILDAVKYVLVEKNKKYGNSALSPIKIFSKLDAQNSIKIRLDDKLSRIKNSDKLRINDLTDVLGYIVLLLASCKADPQKIRELVD